MNTNFFFSMLRGSGDGISSKRFFLFVIVSLFIFEVTAWYGWHIPPNDTLSTQVFTALLAALGAVFGEPLMQAAADKAKKSPTP